MFYDVSDWTSQHNFRQLNIVYNVEYINDVKHGKNKSMSQLPCYNLKQLHFGRQCIKIG